MSDGHWSALVMMGPGAGRQNDGDGMNAKKSQESRTIVTSTDQDPAKGQVTALFVQSMMQLVAHCRLSPRSRRRHRAPTVRDTVTTDRPAAPNLQHRKSKSRTEAGTLLDIQHTSTRARCRQSSGPVRKRTTSIWCRRFCGECGRHATGAARSVYER